MKWPFKRIVTDVIWALVMLILAVVASWRLFALSGWENIGLYVGSILIGLVIPERRLVWMCIVNVFRAAKLLMEQKDDPKRFVWPYIRGIDFFPDPLKGTDLDYIKVTVCWRNALYYRVTVGRIKGEVNIDGSSPSDRFESDTEIVLAPFEEGPLNPVPITVTITRDALKTVKSMRTKRSGKGSFGISFSAQLNGIEAKYTLMERYRYVE